MYKVQKDMKEGEKTIRSQPNIDYACAFRKCNMPIKREQPTSTELYAAVGLAALRTGETCKKMGVMSRGFLRFPHCS